VKKLPNAQWPVEGSGSSFAELPVFDVGNYPAAASAAEDTEVLFVSRNDFQNFCRDDPEVGLKIIAMMGARLPVWLESSKTYRLRPYGIG
jgi:CRP/FNR family transcriptional regulator